MAADCTGVLPTLSPHNAERLRLVEENATLRILLASAYSGSKLYTDDGALEDNSEQPFIDFRKDTPREIRRKMQERALRKLEADPELQARLKHLMSN